MTRSLLCAASFLVLLTSVRAGDWPEFRGPTGQGLVTDGPLPLRWSKTAAAWKQDVPGKGWSSPVIVAGKIYLTAAVPQQGRGQSLCALCLDAKTGKILWNEEVFKQGAEAPNIHSKNSHASPTPLVADDRLYVHFGHQGTACLNLQGKVLWREVQGYKPVHGNGGTPVLVEGALVFSCDGGATPYVIALDAATGQQKWKTPRPGNAPRKFSFSTPLVIDVKGQKQVISPGSDQVNAFDPKTGKILWTTAYTGYSVIPRPVAGQGFIFLSSGYDSPVLLAIKADGSGEIVWRMRKGAPHTPSPLLVGDELYTVADNGVATCVDAKTGKEHWQERLVGTYSASPIVADGKIYFQNERGLGTVVKASTKFEQLSKNDLAEATLASYGAADGALFLRTEKSLYRFEGK